MILGPFNALLVFLSFLTAVIDIIFGMGFGLTMTPILIISGFSPHQIVPALLLSSLAGNILSTYFHHRFENVDFSPKSRYFKISILIGGLGAVGSILGALVAVGISDFYLGLYVGLLVTVAGLFILLNRKLRASFSWRKIVALGLFGSFNKGISGSGFGPVVTTGILLLGIDEKAAVSIQTFSESFVSLVGFLTFALSGIPIDWSLTLSLSTGVILSTPLAAFIVRKTESGKLRLAIALVTIVLGISTILRLFFK